MADSVFAEGWEAAGPMPITVGRETPWLTLHPDGSVVLFRRDGTERLRLTEEQVFALIEGLAHFGEERFYPKETLP